MTQTEVDSVAEKISSLAESLTHKIRAVEEQSLRENVSEQDSGLAYLETKLELLISYCIDVQFYLLFRTEGGNIASHPVIDQILLLQGVFERLKPIDSKMKHQLDRLVQLVTLEATGHVLAPNAESEEVGLRPRLDNLVAVGAESGDEEENANLSSKGRESESATYQAPRLAAVPFEEDTRKDAKEAKRIERMKGRLRQSETLRSVRSEVLGLPEEVAGGTSGVMSLGENARARLMEEDREKQEWEEDHMIRRQVTKAEKKRRKHLLAESSRLETIADVGSEVAGIWATSKGSGEGSRGRRGEGTSPKRKSNFSKKKQRR